MRLRQHDGSPVMMAAGDVVCFGPDGVVEECPGRDLEPGDIIDTTGHVIERRALPAGDRDPASNTPPPVTLFA